MSKHWRQKARKAKSIEGIIMCSKPQMLTLPTWQYSVNETPSITYKIPAGGSEAVQAWWPLGIQTPQSHNGSEADTASSSWYVGLAWAVWHHSRCGQRGTCDGDQASWGCMCHKMHAHNAAPTILITSSCRLTAKDYIAAACQLYHHHLLLQKMIIAWKSHRRWNVEST